MTMMVRSSLFLLLALLLGEYSLATQELNWKMFKDLTTSGKNGMIKFFQPWCGHCMRMKPDWDKLAEEAHFSVFIADVNCSEEAELCAEEGVSGYPTLKVYRGGREEPYQGGRGFDSLLEFVATELAEFCNLKKPETCGDRAQKYATKWKAKKPAEIQKEMGRLGAIEKKDMAADLKSWLRERLTILQQLAPASEEL